MSEPLTLEQVAELRRFATHEAADSALGREWMGRVRPVGLELAGLYAGRPRVRDGVEHALALTAPLVRSREARVTDDVLHALRAALAEIDRSASPRLRALTDAARGELRDAGGKTLREVLGL